MYQNNDYRNYLMHHGILGQKWGVRRYQNADGSLTNAGRIRYDKMSDEKLAKTFKKQIQNKKAKLHGTSNRWRVDLSVGQKSKKQMENRNKAFRKKIKSDKELKKSIETLEKMNSEWEDVTPDKAEEWQKKYDYHADKISKIKFDFGYGKIGFTGSGKGYTDNFVNTYGKNISVAKLQDIGYNVEDAKRYVDRLAKSKITLADF